MKTRTFILGIGILLTLACYGQIPQSFSYQAVVRNSNNELIKNAPVKVKILIGYYVFSGVPPRLTFFPIYGETHQPTTDENGLFTVSVGSGSVIEGKFDTIPWTKNTFYIKTEIDPDNGNNYTISSISQILSVPYALNAHRAQNGVLAYGIVDEEGNIIGGSGNFTVRTELVIQMPFTYYEYYLSLKDKLPFTNVILLVDPDPENLNAGRVTYTLTPEKDIRIKIRSIDDPSLYVSAGFQFVLINPF